MTPLSHPITPQLELKNWESSVEPAALQKAPQRGWGTSVLPK